MSQLKFLKQFPVLICAVLAGTAQAEDPQYSVTDLGPIGYVPSEFNTAQEQLLRVNDSGLVAGSSQEAEGQRAIVYESGSQSYSVLPSPGDAAASGLNNNGQIVGWHQLDGQRHASFWQKSAGSWQLTALPLPTPYVSSQAWGINDNGVIVGSLNNGTDDYAVYWPDFNTNPVLIGSEFIGEAFAINNNDQITGVYGKSGFQSGSSAFIWKIGDSIESLLPNISNDLGTANTSWGGVDINESGAIIGGSDAMYSYYSGYNFPVTHPFAWNSSDGISDLHPTSPQTAWANSINDVSYVVGGHIVTLTPSNNTAWPLPGVESRQPFVYRQELNASGEAIWNEYLLWDHIPTEDQAIWHFYKASDNSNIGHIVGLAGKLIDGQYQWHGYLLTPAVADLALNQTVTQVNASAKTSRYSKADVSSTFETEIPIQLSLNITNYGPLTASQLTLDATLQQGLNVDSVSSDKGNCSTTLDAENNTKLQCHLDELAVNNSVKVTATFSADIAGDYAVSTTASANELDSLNSSNNLYETNIKIIQKISAENNEPTTEEQTPTTNNNSQSNTDENGKKAALSTWLLLLILPLLISRLAGRRATASTPS